MKNQETVNRVRGCRNVGTPYYYKTPEIAFSLENQGDACRHAFDAPRLTELGEYALDTAAWD